MSYRAMTELAYDKWRERLSVTPIPLCDEDDWLMFPQHRWMHNKLQLCDVQGIQAFPHGIVPEQFPVFSKPIYNLLGCSTGAQILHGWKDEYYQPGHFWMSLLEGRQVSMDVVVNHGEVVWRYTMEPLKDVFGSFAGWQSSYSSWGQMKAVDNFCERWFSNFSGAVNFELIGASIIEAHPRCSAEFLDFFGSNWLDRVEHLFHTGEWLQQFLPDNGYQGVMRSVCGPCIPEVDITKVKQLEETDGIFSIFLPFLPGQQLQTLNPDGAGTWRIALVSGRDQKTVNNVIHKLRELIKLT